MSPVRIRTLARLAVLAVLTTAIARPILVRAEAITRTVYVTITDDKGAPVPDLSASNFKVKEGGKDREIVKAEKATTKAHVAIMVEEKLIGDTQTRMGLFEFVKRMNGAADMSLITMGLRNTTLVPFVSDANTVLKAINELSLNPQPTSNVTECIGDMAKLFQTDKPQRPVMVVVAFSGGQAGGASASSILNEIRQSGATMFAATYGPPATNNSANLGTMGDESFREQVLGDGAKNSGGRRIDVVSTAAFTKALLQIADDLASQYAISYALPEGTKLDKRFTISLDRKGLTMRAPAGLPDK
jgi:von Willebrand factor type A domain